MVVTINKLSLIFIMRIEEKGCYTHTHIQMYTYIHIYIYISSAINIHMSLAINICIDR